MGHEELAVLFRNNHFSTIYKYQGRLYILVTDQGFLREPKVVWETLCSVQGDSTFTDAALEPEGGEARRRLPFLPLFRSLLLAYSLQEEYRRLANQEEQWEEEKKWLTTRDQVPGGCEDKDAPGPTNASGRPLSDEELAHLMQEEENAQAQARGALGEHGHRSHSADQLRRTSPPYPQQMREVGTRERQRRNTPSVIREGDVTAVAAGVKVFCKLYPCEIDREAVEGELKRLRRHLAVVEKKERKLWICNPSSQGLNVEMENETQLQNMRCSYGHKARFDPANYGTFSMSLLVEEEYDDLAKRASEVVGFRIRFRAEPETKESSRVSSSSFSTQQRALAERECAI
ncbi:unnamed protein product [Cyprideis torosa]|uniref:Ubiquitin carboxyl-terminal hydrolase n=1 Tax=Cyprideis torosa TaxID=163714 RepID=A0A7R8W4X9_9CRUS|nr:unnamed protein product [Cyprideis torosa]CAG0880296.1 unnamed protein product [Cyprideis torosa]